MKLVEVRIDVVRGDMNDGTHGRKREVRMIAAVIALHLIDTASRSYEERIHLSRRVEISNVCEWGSSDGTTRRQRGTDITSPDNPQGGGRHDRCVGRFDDPRFVLLHANCGIAADGVPPPQVHVRGKATRRGVINARPDEDCLDGGPPSRVFLEIQEGAEVNTVAVVRRTHCSARVRHGGYERVQQLTEEGDC